MDKKKKSQKKANYEPIMVTNHLNKRKVRAEQVIVVKEKKRKNLKTYLFLLAVLVTLIIIGTLLLVFLLRAKSITTRKGILNGDDDDDEDYVPSTRFKQANLNQCLLDLDIYVFNSMDHDQNAGLFEFPYSVALETIEPGELKRIFCSGILIEEKIVLTSVDCVTNRVNITVYIGLNNIVPADRSKIHKLDSFDKLSRRKMRRYFIVI